MRKKSFTYVELLITLAIIGVLFIPVMQLFSHSLHSTGASGDIITATNLAKWEMEKIKNLNITKAQLEKIGDVVYPSLEEEPLELNNARWRIKREVMPGSSPLEVRVHVYRDRNLEDPIISLVTLVEDMYWKELVPLR